MQKEKKEKKKTHKKLSGLFYFKYFFLCYSQEEVNDLKRLHLQHLIQSRCVICGRAGGSFSMSLALLMIDLWQKFKSVCFFFIVFSFLNIFLSIKMFAWTTVQCFRCEIVERSFPSIIFRWKATRIHSRWSTQEGGNSFFPPTISVATFTATGFTKHLLCTRSTLSYGPNAVWYVVTLSF